MIENALLKVNTAEGHDMTAVEAALELAGQLKKCGLTPERDVASSHVRTQKAAMNIINK